jgi:cytochrome P450
MMQQMIDATLEDESGQRRGLTDSEIIGNIITFMLAGYETTASALSYTSYLLALNPHIQEKLQKEIDSYMEENPVGYKQASFQKVVHDNMGAVTYVKTTPISESTLAEWPS